MPQSLTKFDKLVYYIWSPTREAPLKSYSISGVRKIFKDGVLIVFATLMTSFRRGTPNVTFIEAIPALWNVFNVICVAGSPID